MGLLGDEHARQNQTYREQQINLEMEKQSAEDIEVTLRQQFDKYARGQ